MISDKRLQEIRLKNCDPHSLKFKTDTEWKLASMIEELIAALESCQQELAETDAELVIGNKLAGVQAYTDYENYADKIFAHHGKDCARTWDVDPAWVEWCEYIRLDIYKEVKAQLAASQAENERLRTEISVRRLPRNNWKQAA